MIHSARIFILLVMCCTCVCGANANDLPDHMLTPGLATNITRDKLCAKTFHTRDERFVSEKTKARVYNSYHMRRGVSPCPCEVDHLVSLELGGSNDERNLWPQSYVTRPWNAHVKDELENVLHKLVCSGEIILDKAQHGIANDWIGMYKRYVR